MSARPTCARVAFGLLAAAILVVLLVCHPAGWLRAEARESSILASAMAQSCSVEQGQLLIDQGQYKRAIREFTCVIDAQPTEVEGYRGRIEAELLLGLYSDAVRDYTRVTAFVLPVHPDAQQTIYDGYSARLSASPDDVVALTGASFARWYFFDYAAALQVLDELLEVRPDDLYGQLFRGSTRLLLGPSPAAGAADLERAIAIAPSSPDVRFIVADAYTYGASDPQRAFQEASLALAWGLDTPRVHAILASALLAFGNEVAAATHIKRHIDLVTTATLTTAPLLSGTLALGLVPGRTYHIPVPLAAGETLSIATRSRDFSDTILVLLAPDGSPVTGNDDRFQYFAGLNWVAGATATYGLRVTSFEGVSTGVLSVARR